MLVDNTNELKLQLQDGINYKILKDAMQEKGYTFSIMEGLTFVAEGTIKNIVYGKVRNPGADNLAKICKVLDVPLEKVLGGEVTDVKTQIEIQGIKEGNVSVIALKDIYEHQEAILSETNEKHINNIRQHYQQHHEDLKENYERRLADKRELIDTKDAHIKTLERECLSYKVFSWICVLVLVSILIAELMNPNLGWLRW